MLCPHCQKEVPDGFQFCGHCGKDLRESLRAERRDVTIIFADMKGFTSMSEKMEPDYAAAERVDGASAPFEQKRAAWEAFLAALHMMPDQPEMYYLLGQALAGVGRTDDARAMFAAAVDLAPYRARYRKALASVPGPLAVAP